jgi:hypothetical protein
MNVRKRSNDESQPSNVLPFTPRSQSKTASKAEQGAAMDREVVDDDDPGPSAA